MNYIHTAFYSVIKYIIHNLSGKLEISQYFNGRKFNNNILCTVNSNYKYFRLTLQGTPSLKWIDFNLSVDKLSHSQ